MTTDEFVPWALTRPKEEHYELVRGEVVRMAPEQVGHVRAKSRVWLALRDAVEGLSESCEVVGDGLGVRVDSSIFYQPDALVRCGERLGDETLYVDDPMIIVEVLSPSTQSTDTGAKLLDYFRLPALAHYLVVDWQERSVLHYRRAGQEIGMSVCKTGGLELVPPGITLQVDRLFSG